MIAAFHMSGCLLPQDDAEIEPIVEANSPPRILEQNVLPAPTIRVHPTCVPGLTFSAFVEDPDVNDFVVVRWYLDFDPANALTRFPVQDDEELPNDGKAVRPQAAKLLGSSVAERLAVVDSHRVDLMVFDGDLLSHEGPGSQPRPDPLPGRDAGNPRYSNTFTWLVHVETGAPACP